MKTLKTLPLLLGILVLSCKNTNGDFVMSNPDSGFTSILDSKATIYEFKDAKTGLTVSSIEYPDDWKVIAKPRYDVDPSIPFFLYQIQGPSNIKVFNSPLKMFYASPNPQMEQNLRNSGLQNVRSLLSIEALMEKDIKPMMTAQGFSFERTRPLTALERYFTQKVHESAATAETSLLAVQWKGASGQKALTIISYLTISQALFTGDTANIWMYNVDYLLAEDAQFEDVVETFINANTQIKENPEWKNHVAAISAQRREETRRQSQRQIESLNRATNDMIVNHQNTMVQRQASFDAHQQRMADRSAAGDASHAAFMNNNFGSGATSSTGNLNGQQSFLNMINEEETVANPNGYNYQVESGAKEYWMDSDGNYIKSNDLFFDPNANLNNTVEWFKVKDDH